MPAKPPPRTTMRSLIGSAECEAVGLGAGVEEFDLEQRVVDPAGLPDKLVQPLLVERAATLLVDVRAVVLARRLPVQEDPEWDRGAGRRRAHHEVHVASVEANRDAP